jgi:hypothetical protein
VNELDHLSAMKNRICFTAVKTNPQLGKSWKRLFSIVSLAVVAAMGNMQAQTLTWDPGLNGTGSNGNATWDNGTTPDWATGSGDTTFGTTNVAVVGVAGGSGTYTISVASGGVTAAGLTLAAAGTGAYTFQGGTLNLSVGGAGTAITVNDSAIFNNKVVFSGTGNNATISFTTGGQTLTYNAGGTIGSGFSGTSTNGLTSSVSLNTGAYTLLGAGPELNIGTSGMIGSTSGLSGGLTFNTGATATTSVSDNIGGGTNGLVTINGGALTNSGGFIIAGRGEGANQVGRFVLTTGTVTGVDTLINFQGGSGAGTTGGGEVDINGGTYTQTGYVGLGSAGSNGAAVLNIAGGTSTIQALYLGGSGGAFANGAGGSNTLTVSGGAVYFGTGGIVSEGTGTNSVTLSGGKVGASGNWSSSVNIALSNANGGVTFEADDGAATPTMHNITLSGNLTGNGFTKTGAGTLAITGTTNTYSGPTLISAGTLSLASGGTSSVEVAAGATLQLNLATSMAATATLTLDSTTTSDVALDYAVTGTDAIGALYIDGVQITSGIYTAAQLDAMKVGGVTVSDFSDNSGGLNTITVGVVPEPRTWAMLFLGLGLLVGLARWRRLARVL